MKPNVFLRFFYKTLKYQFLIRRKCRYRKFGNFCHFKLSRNKFKLVKKYP